MRIIRYYSPQWFIIILVYYYTIILQDVLCVTASFISYTNCGVNTIPQGGVEIYQTAR